MVCQTYWEAASWHTYEAPWHEGAVGRLNRNASLCNRHQRSDQSVLETAGVHGGEETSRQIVL